MSEATTISEGQYVNVPCECGTKGGAYLKHYGIVRCSCGRMHWALQPRRGGPLISFPWLGNFFTRTDKTGMPIPSTS